jgi:hypothetical protein
VEGKVRAVEVHGLLDAGPTVIVAGDGNGGQYPLFFQGSPTIKPAAARGGTLHSLDLETRRILWSFSHRTPEPNWPFGFVTPMDGGLWVSSYRGATRTP